MFQFVVAIGRSPASRWLFTLLVLLSAICPLSAAPPTITAVTPRGAMRGQPVEIVVQGANLTSDCRLQLPFQAEQTVVPEDKPNPARVRFRLNVPASVPLGLYPVRVIGDDGISPLFLFGVDAFPAANEAEDNSSPEKAQAVPVPVVITGQCAGGDIDHFRFPGKKGQRLVIETEAARLGSGILPQLRLTDAGQRFLAADDSQRVQGDARIIFEVPADGDYIVELCDTRYRAANPPHYRLKIGEYDVVEEVFPLGGKQGETVEFALRGGTLPREVTLRRPLTGGAAEAFLGIDGSVRPGTAAPRVAIGELPEVTVRGDRAAGPLMVQPPQTINGRLENKGDVHRYQFPAQAGQKYRCTVQAESLGSQLDAVLRITDPSGKQLVLADDTPIPPTAPGQPATSTVDPGVDVAVPMGVSALVVELRDQRGRGGVNFGYRLTIEPALPDFEAFLAEAEVNVPRGGAAVLQVTIRRRDFTDPITLAVPNLPPGLSVQGGHIPGNQTRGFLTVSAAADATGGPWDLSFEARATADGKPLVRRAQFRMNAVAGGNQAIPVLTLPQVSAALSSPPPFRVSGPEAVDVVLGYPATVPVTVTRTMPDIAAVEVSASDPAGTKLVTAKPASAPTGASSAVLELTLPANANEGLVDLAINGKARVGKADQVLPGPAVTLNIRRPFAVEVAPTGLKLVPGQTAILSGKIVRQAVFKEPVQLKLAGLPRGVTAPANLPPVTGNEFRIELKVDAKAAATPANLTLTASATIAGGNQALPPITIPLQFGP